MPEQGEVVLMDLIPTSLCCPPYQVIRDLCITQKRLPGGSKPQREFKRMRGGFDEGGKKDWTRVRRVSKHTE